MSIPPPPQPYDVCKPEEKLRRLKVSYAHGWITLEELEERTMLALEEEDYYGAKEAGVELTPTQQKTKERLDREQETRLKAFRSSRD